MSRPIPAPPESFLPFVNGYDIASAGYNRHHQDVKLLAWARGAWRPVADLQQVNRRSADVTYRTGDGIADVERQRMIPERVAAPGQRLAGLTAAELHRGDLIEAGPIPSDLCAQIGEHGVGSRGLGEPWIHMTIRTRDGGRELCSRSPDAGPFTVRRILPALLVPPVPLLEEAR